MVPDPMLGGLHTEMAAFKALCDWLDGSEYALVQAGVVKSSMAKYLMKASQITHQVTTAALFVLQ